jgi:hypothetical protein
MSEYLISITCNDTTGFYDALTLACKTDNSEEDFQALAQHAASEVRGNVASNGSCPPAILAKLAKDPNIWVRLQLAGNPSCPAESLIELALDKTEEVRSKAVHNPSCPIEARLQSLFSFPARSAYGLRFLPKPVFPL